MCDITVVNLSAIDLNLLHVLAVVLEERSATRAARRLHVTQSAVSNALARLRDVLGDALVIRQGRGLVPTPRALELQPRLAAALGELESVVGGDAVFDPSTCEREFTVACADNQQLADLPSLCRALERRMPNARLRVVSIDTLLATDGLATGEVDVALSPEAAHPGLPKAPLYAETPVGLLAKRHPYRGRTLTPRAFAELPQVAFSLALGRPGFGRKATERAFQSAGFTPRTVLTVPSFAAAAGVVAQTRLLACMPRRVARVLASSLPVRLVELPPPLEKLSMPMSLVWHPRTERDAASVFFRNLLLDTLREPRTPPGGDPSAAKRRGKSGRPA